jgi:DNA-binding LacI/PurR family transcriptional regulator
LLARANKDGILMSEPKIVTQAKVNLKGGMTQKHIAEQLGVSRQLVSFALRGEGRVSEDTRRKILETAQQGGYHEFTNREARVMVSKRYGKRVRTGIIAVLFQPTFEGQPLSSVPFFMPFFDGIESEAIEQGLDLMLCPLRPQGLPRLLLDGQVDGVICLLTDNVPAELLDQLSVPLVHILLVTDWCSQIENALVLGMDARGGIEMATRHLIELGHRRIAFLGIASPRNNGMHLENQRYEGYCEALRAAGISLDEALVDIESTGPTIQTGVNIMKRLLQPDGTLLFSAMVCYNDLIAMGAIRVLREAGYRVPEDVSVVGFDDLSDQYGFSPALTSIRFPREEMGRRAVKMLCNNEANESLDVVLPERNFLPAELVQRDSVRTFSLDSSEEKL